MNLQTVSGTSKTLIVKYPDKRLIIPSEEVGDFSEAKKIAKQLLEVINSVDFPINLWLGMSAPQVGHNKRIIVLRKSYKHYQVMVNPEIVEKKWLLPSLSSCYSIKGLYVVKRYYWIKVKYFDIEGISHQEIIRGNKACAFQHEIDHLNGKLLGK